MKERREVRKEKEMEKKKCEGKQQHTNKDLADGTADCEPKDILPDCWVASHKVESGGQFARATGHVHTDPFSQTRAYEIGTGKEI